MKNICIIPARSGSKRIKNKNIKDFLGRPIISYSIQLAFESKLFDYIMVSTNCSKIKSIAIKYGAEVPFLRSDSNSDDYSTLSDVVEEVKYKLNKLNMNFDNLSLLLPTAPLARVSDLKRGLELLKKNSFDYICPIVKYKYPVYRSLKFDSKSKEIAFAFKNNSKERSQDLEELYHDAGQFYWSKYSTGLKSKNKRGFEIPSLYSQDIDTDDDWILAEIKYKIINKITDYEK